MLLLRLLLKNQGIDYDESWFEQRDIVDVVDEYEGQVSFGQHRLDHWDKGRTWSFGVEDIFFLYRRRQTFEIYSNDPKHTHKNIDNHSLERVFQKGKYYILIKLLKQVPYQIE